jgi:AcrR family transcriptional regulator
MTIHERQSRDRERRRQQIIAASKRVFLSKGASRATIKDIADEAELSPGTLYIYFKNKDELYVSLSIRILKHLNLRLQRVQANRELPYDQKINSVKQAFCEVYEVDPPMLINLYHLQSSETLENISAELFDEIMTLSRQCLKTLSEIFAKGIQAGCFISVDPMKIALILWSMFSGLVVWEESKRALDPRKDHLMPTLDLAFEIFARGTAKRNTD